MQKFVSSEFEMAVDKIKGKQTTINSPGCRRKRYRTLASFWGTMGQQEGAAAVNRTMVDGKLLIFLGLRTMDHVRRASPADTKLDRGRVGMGLGKGSGVLLLGATASFLSKDAFGHNDGNRAILDGYFC